MALPGLIFHPISLFLKLNLIKLSNKDHVVSYFHIIEILDF